MDDRKGSEKELYSDGSRTRDTLVKGDSKFQKGRKRAKGFLREEDLLEKDSLPDMHAARIEYRQRKRKKQKRKSSAVDPAGKEDSASGNFSPSYPSDTKAGTILYGGAKQNRSQRPEKPEVNHTAPGDTWTEESRAEDIDRAEPARTRLIPPIPEVGDRALQGGSDIPEEEQGGFRSSLPEGQAAFLTEGKKGTQSQKVFQESRYPGDAGEAFLPGQDGQAIHSQNIHDTEGYFKKDFTDISFQGGFKKSGTDQGTAFIPEEPGGASSGKGFNSHGFRTVTQGYSMGKRFAGGMGRFTNRFVNTANKADQDDSPADQTVSTAAGIVRGIRRGIQFAARQVIKLAQLILGMLTGGSAFAFSGCLLPGLVILGGILLFVVILIAVIIIVFSIIAQIALLLINALFAADISGSGMYIYAYDCAVEFQQECQEYLDAVEDVRLLHIYFDGEEIDPEEYANDIEIDYEMVYLMYLGMNETAWYADADLNLVEGSADSNLADLMTDTEENRALFDALFEEMYSVEIAPTETDAPSEEDESTEAGDTEASSEAAESSTEAEGTAEAEITTAETSTSEEGTEAGADEPETETENQESSITIHIYTWDGYQNTHPYMSDIGVTNVLFLFDAYANRSDLAQGLGVETAGEQVMITFRDPEDQE